MTASLILMVTLTVGLLAAPLAAQARRADTVFRIGVLGHSSASASAGRIEAFRQALCLRRSGRVPQAQAAAAVAGSRATGLDVELGALTVALRLGDVPGIGESSPV